MSNYRGRAEKLDNPRGLNVAVEDVLYEKLRKRAYQEGHSNISEVVRKAIEEYLNI